MWNIIHCIFQSEIYTTLFNDVIATPSYQLAFLPFQSVCDPYFMKCLHHSRVDTQQIANTMMTPSFTHSRNNCTINQLQPFFSHWNQLCLNQLSTAVQMGTFVESSMTWDHLLQTIQSKYFSQVLCLGGVQSMLCDTVVWVESMNWHSSRCTVLSSNLDGKAGRHSQELTQALLEGLQGNSNALWYNYGINENIRVQRPFLTLF